MLTTKPHNIIYAEPLLDVSEFASVIESAESMEYKNPFSMPVLSPSEKIKQNFGKIKIVDRSLIFSSRLFSQIK